MELQSNLLLKSSLSRLSQRFINDSITPAIEQLKLGLREFGLNPEDWSIQFKEFNQALITHSAEDDFQFIGKVNTAKNNWEYIQLYNL